MTTAVADLLAGDLPDEPTVVVAGTGPVAPPALAAAHGGRPGVVVVGAAPVDHDLGQQGALAGLGRGWAAGRDDLAAALRHAPASEAELRWLLWNDGVEVAPAPGAASEPTALPDGAAAVLGDRVPLPGVRPWELREATVPTVTVVVHGLDVSPYVLGPWPDRGRVASEVVLVGGDAPVTGRVRSAADLFTAVRDARGAWLWFVHTGAVAHREAWARALRRCEDERLDRVQVAYELPSGVSRADRGLLLADAELGAPAFALVRRRALLRRLRGDADLLAAWGTSVAEDRGTTVTSHPVEVDVAVASRPVPTLRTLAAAPREAAADLARAARGRLRDGGATTAADDVAPTEQHGDVARPSVGWVGFSGHGNFGDELVLRAARQLLPGVDVLPGQEGTHGTVLGGGTLLNADRYYQRIADDIDAPGLARLVLGTGVVSPEVKGWTEELDGWHRFLAAGPVGVRGPHSLAHLRDWGHDGPAEVLGDPALVVTADVPPVDGLVVLAPIGASDVGQVAADDEAHQLELLAAAGRAAAADGRQVRLLTAHAGDDRVALALLRELGDVVADVVHGHRDLDAGLELLAAADVVVAARLHALVAAAAAGTSFLGLAYRPKVVDFAASVGVEDRVAPIGAWTREALVGALQDRDGERQVEQHEAMVAAVRDYRARLRARAADYLAELGVPRPTEPPADPGATSP